MVCDSYLLYLSEMSCKQIVKIKCYVNWRQNFKYCYNYVVVWNLEYDIIFTDALSGVNFDKQHLFRIFTKTENSLQIAVHNLLGIVEKLFVTLNLQPST